RTPWAAPVQPRSSTSSSGGTEMAIPRFWREIQSRYNLIGTKCGSCGKVDFPPRAVCPTCGRRSVGKMERLHLKGKGAVVTYTVIHDPGPLLRPGLGVSRDLRWQMMPNSIAEKREQDEHRVFAP